MWHIKNSLTLKETFNFKIEWGIRILQTWTIFNNLTRYSIYIYVIYQLGDPYRETLCPRSWTYRLRLQAIVQEHWPCSDLSYTSPVLYPLIKLTWLQYSLFKIKKYGIQNSGFQAFQFVFTDSWNALYCGDWSESKYVHKDTYWWICLIQVFHLILGTNISQNFNFLSFISSPVFVLLLVFCSWHF